MDPISPAHQSSLFLGFIRGNCHQDLSDYLLGIEKSTNVYVGFCTKLYVKLCTVLYISYIGYPRDGKGALY